MKKQAQGGDVTCLRAPGARIFSESWRWVWRWSLGDTDENLLSLFREHKEGGVISTAGASYSPPGGHLFHLQSPGDAELEQLPIVPVLLWVSVLFPVPVLLLLPVRQWGHDQAKYVCLLHPRANSAGCGRGLGDWGWLWAHQQEAPHSWSRVHQEAEKERLLLWGSFQHRPALGSGSQQEQLLRRAGWHRAAGTSGELPAGAAGHPGLAGHHQLWAALCGLLPGLPHAGGTAATCPVWHPGGLQLPDLFWGDAREKAGPEQRTGGRGGAELFKQQ